MTAPEQFAESPHPTTVHASVSPTRLLASALLHVIARDEPPPARWRAAAFVVAVMTHRARFAGIRTCAELDRLAPATDSTFRGAVTALASDPLAAALAVRRLELTRAGELPAWPEIIRHGVAPRVTHAEASLWFG